MSPTMASITTIKRKDGTTAARVFFRKTFAPTFGGRLSHAPGPTPMNTMTRSSIRCGRGFTICVTPAPWLIRAGVLGGLDWGFGALAERRTAAMTAAYRSPACFNDSAITGAIRCPYSGLMWAASRLVGRVPTKLGHSFPALQNHGRESTHAPPNV